MHAAALSAPRGEWDWRNQVWPLWAHNRRMGTSDTGGSHASGTVGSTIPQTIDFLVNSRKEMAGSLVPDFHRATEPTTVGYFWAGPTGGGAA